MTQYYVDPVSGNDNNSGLSTGQAWATIGKAQSSAYAGDIVNLMSGSYGAVSWDSGDNRGTSGNWIIFRQYAGDPAFSADFTNILFQGNYDFYIEFQGIEVTTGNSYWNCVRVEDGNYIILRECSFKGAGDSIATQPSESGVQFGGSSYCQVIDSTFFRTRKGCGIVGGCQHCSCIGNHVSELQTTCFNVGSAGEGGDGTAYTLIEANIVHEHTTYTGHGGSGVAIRESNTIVRNNVFYNFGSTRPIRTYQNVKSSGGYANITVENNVVYYLAPYTAQWTHWVEFVDMGENFVLRNNTFAYYFVIGYADSGVTLGYAEASDVASWKIYNNIIGRHLKIYASLSLAAGISEGNNFYEQLWVDDSRYYDATNVWPGSNSVVGDINNSTFFEETEQAYPFGAVYPFELKSGSPAINFGDTSEAPTLDLLGRSRVGNADAGAYEFGVGAGTKTFSVGAVLQEYLLTKTFTVDSRVVAHQTKYKECTASARLTSAAPDLYDTLWIDFTSFKLFWIDGQFTSTVNDSQTISGVTAQPRGISSTSTTDTLWCEGGDEGSDKLHLQSGRFTSTIKDSQDISGWNSRPQDCSLDDNGDVVWCGDGAMGANSSLFLHSGLFTTTLKTSQNVTDSIVGCSFDENGNVPWCNSDTSKLYLTSGEFSSTIKTSLNISAIEDGPRGISWNGLGETLVSGIEADKLYKFSGQFTTTIHDSQSVAVASPQGIDTSDWFVRLNGAPAQQTKTFSVGAVLVKYVKEFTVSTQLVNRFTKGFTANAYTPNRFIKTATVGVQMSKQETKECTVDVYLVHAQNLITNGHFSFWTADDPDDWTVTIGGGESGSNYVEEDDKKCHYVAAGGTLVTLKQSGVLESNGRYLVRLNIVSITGTLIMWGGGTSTEITTTGQKEFSINCGDQDTDFLFSFDTSCNVVFDNVEVYVIGVTFEIDGRLVDRSVKDLTAGAKTTDRLTKECTAGARLAHIKTFSAGVRLTELETKTFEIDAVLQKPLTKTCTAGTALQDQSLTKTCTADSYLVDRFTKTFAINSQVVDRSVKVFSIGAGLVRLKTCTANAYLVFVKALTVHAYLVRKKTLLAGAQLVNRSTKTCTASAHIIIQPVKPTIIGGLVVDRSILAVTVNTKVIVRHSVTFTGSARLGGIKTCNAGAHLTTELTKTVMAIIVLESSLNIDEPVDVFQSTHKTVR